MYLAFLDIKYEKEPTITIKEKSAKKGWKSSKSPPVLTVRTLSKKEFKTFINTNSINILLLKQYFLVASHI